MQSEESGVNAMYKLLIAEGSEGYADSLQAVFEKEFDLRVCRDGETALETLMEFQPDALVINLMLPYMDGLTVLQETLYRPKVILAITPFVNHYIEEVTLDLGVQFIMIMPTVASLRVRLMDLIATNIAPKEDLNAQAAVLLHSLNFSVHLDGYQQLCVAIPMYAKNPELLVSKELYPAVAKHFGLTDPRTVEHSIRKAISVAWIRKTKVSWSKFFAMDITKEEDDRPCPSNKEFIACVAKHLEL